MKQKVYNLLRWSEKYTKTDMIYLTKGGFWLTLSQSVSAIAGLLLTILLAKFLSQNTFGTYKYIISIASIIAIPTLSGLNTSLTQAVARGYDGDVKNIFLIKLKYGSISLLACSAVSLYYWSSGNLALATIFLILGFFIPIMEAFGIYDSILNGKNNYFALASYSTASIFFTTFSLIVVSYFSDEIIYLVFTYFLSWSLVRIIFFYKTKQVLFNKETGEDSVKYGFHLSAISVLGNISSQIDRIILFHYFGASNLAIYTIAIAIPDRIRGIFKDLISRLAIPKLAGRTKLDLKRKSFIVIIVVLSIIIIYYLITPILLPFLFPDYAEKELVKYSRISILTLLGVIPSIYGADFIANKYKRILYATSTITNIFQIVALLIGAYFAGIIGILISRALTQVMTIFLYEYIYRTKENHK